MHLVFSEHFHQVLLPCERRIDQRIDDCFLIVRCFRDRVPGRIAALAQSDELESSLLTDPVDGQVIQMVLMLQLILQMILLGKYYLRLQMEAAVL